MVSITTSRLSVSKLHITQIYEHLLLQYMKIARVCIGLEISTYIDYTSTFVYENSNVCLNILN